MTGYRAFSREFVKCCPVVSCGFEVETEMTIHALDKNEKIVSVPVGYSDRPEGSESKLSTVSDGIKVLFKIFNLFREYRPLAFFGLFSALFLVAGLVLFLPVMVEFVETGLVPKFPSLIAAGVFLVLSLLSFTTGVQADLITKKHRQLYELMCNLQSSRQQPEGQAK